MQASHRESIGLFIVFIQMLVELSNPCAAAKTKSGPQQARNIQIVRQLTGHRTQQILPYCTCALQLNPAVKTPGTVCSFIGKKWAIEGLIVLP